MELLTLLRTIAPEFEELEDTVLQTWLDLTQPLVSKSAFGAAYEQAVAYLAAHRRRWLDWVQKVHLEILLIEQGLCPTRRARPLFLLAITRVLPA